MTQSPLTPSEVQSLLALRRRFRAYLEDQARVGFGQRYGLAIILAGMGLFCLIGALAFASGAIGGVLTGVAFLLFAFASAQKNAPKQGSRAILGQKGVPVWGVLIQANQLLFEPGERNHPCLVLFSFEPAGGHIDYLQRLAGSIFELKETQQTDPDLRVVANYVTDERSVYFRRRKLPISFTGGPTVYCADLTIVRSCLPKGFLTERVLPCLAEPGEQGALALLPWWMAAGQDAQPN